MIHPHLLNGITVWGNAFDKHLKRLATLQNKAVTLISGAQWHDHVTPSYLKLQILKLNDLYSYEVAKLMRKHTRKTLPIGLSTFFAPVKTIHTRGTRLASSELIFTSPDTNLKNYKKALTRILPLYVMIDKLQQNFTKMHEFSWIRGQKKLC